MQFKIRRMDAVLPTLFDRAAPVDQMSGLAKESGAEMDSYTCTGGFRTDNST